ncbi:hypothetical protein GOODEAATRI_030776 [Goodea atripinnis]|uniref:Uncharacterized protein n=1 Tax=Goodea atripinnis TaxID=208336 RepID=A0ABV0MWI8_9TELE
MAFRSDCHIRPEYHRVPDEPGRFHQHEPCCWLGYSLQSGSVPAHIHRKLHYIINFIIFTLIFIGVFNSNGF